MDLIRASSGRFSGRGTTRLVETRQSLCHGQLFESFRVALTHRRVLDHGFIGVGAAAAFFRPFTGRGDCFCGESVSFLAALSG